MERTIIRCGGGVQTSAGGNGAPDAGKVPVFGAGGGLRAQTGLFDAVVQVGGGGEAGEISVRKANSTACSLRADNLIFNQVVQLPENSGTLALTSQLPPTGTQTLSSVTGIPWDGSPLVYLDSYFSSAQLQLSGAAEGSELTLYSPLWSYGAWAEAGGTYFSHAGTIAPYLYLLSQGAFARIKLMAGVWVVLYSYNINVTY